MPMKSSPLDRQQLASARGVLVVREDHLAHRGDALALEEHVLRAAQADALGAELRAFRASAGVSALVRTLRLRARRPSP